MTVATLIALLQAQPGDARVALEGCDCVGECAGLTYEEHERLGKIVTLTRPIPDEGLVEYDEMPAAPEPQK